MVKPNGLCFGLVPFAPRVEGTKARVHISPRKGCDTSHLTNSSAGVTRSCAPGSLQRQRRKIGSPRGGLADPFETPVAG